MIATTLMAVVVSGVVSAFLLFSKGGIAMGNYERMTSSSRALLETLGRDVRAADGATFPTARRLALSIGGATVAYEFDPAKKTVTVSRSDSAAPPRALATSVSSFSFGAYDNKGASVALSSSAANNIKMIQARLALAEKAGAKADTTAEFVSPRFVLRNKAIPAP